MKLTGLEIPCIYKNVSEYLLFDYTDEIQLGKELCSVRLIRLETADLFKNKNTDLSDADMSADNHIAVITSGNDFQISCEREMDKLLKGVSDFLKKEISGLSADRLELCINYKNA